MQYSPSSNSASSKSQKAVALSAWKSGLTWICRLLFGCTFVFSGFVKAVDPWGTYYKFQDYLSAMGLDVVPNLILTGVFALCTVEFLIGFFILTGSYRKSAPIGGLAFMAIMLPLTLWIAISDPVEDCGCFGDALLISNWATFWKNVVLTCMVTWLLKHNRNSYAFITPALQWIGVVVSIVYIGFIISCGYFKQPLLDFRPYPVGEPLISEDDTADDPEYVFLYARNGETHEFGEEDELPSEDDGWEFLERKVVQKSTSPAQYTHVKTFRIWDSQGDNDMTESVISESASQMILLIPDLSTLSPAITWKINALYDTATHNGVDMIAAVAGNSSLIKEWSDLSMPEYEIYMGEDTAIKEVARGNPAVLFLENGIVKWKTTLSSLDIEEIKTPDDFKRLNEELSSGRDVLNTATYLYLIIIGVIIALSFFPNLHHVYRFKRKRDSAPIHDDTAHHEE